MTAKPNDESAWRLGLLSEMLRLAHVFEQNNFDEERYRGESPASFRLSQHASYLNFFVECSSRLFQARQLLADSESHTLFDQLILFKLLGHLHVRLPLSQPEKLRQVAVPVDWKISDSEHQGAFGPLSVFCVPVDEEQIWMKCWATNISAFLARQYYFDRDGEIIEPVLGDHILDAGGCFGDTALFFANSAGPDGHVYTFDPIRKHCAIMRESFQMNSALEQRISIFEVGLSDTDEFGTRHSGEAIDPGARVGTNSGLPLRTIDGLVGEGKMPRVDFIKMDIEGSELAALRGAARTIATWKPKLAISLYHRPEDFFTIPLWIDSLGLGYNFYLDHYSIHQEETVLYASNARA